MVHYIACKITVVKIMTIILQVVEVHS